MKGEQIKKVALILLLLNLQTYAIVVRAEGYIETRRSANLYTLPTNKSAVIQKLEAGVILREIGGGEREKGYWKVELEGAKRGYIYQTLGKFSPYSPSALYAQSDCEKYLLYGIPTKVDQLLCRIGYVSGYSYKYRIPIWVAYIATYESSQSNLATRQDNFVEDISIAPGQYRVTKEDYDNSGYDRGHMAPSSLIDQTQLSNDQTFLMTNIVPQRPWINRDVFSNKGVWGAIEDSVSCWIKLKERKRLYIISGVTFSDNFEVVGNGVAVPKGLYKIVMDLESMEVISFFIEDQEKSKNDAENLNSYVKNIDYIEDMSGVDFFSTIAPEIQDKIESNVPPMGQWLFYDRQPEVGCLKR